MAHMAELDENNIVLRVIVVSDSDMFDNENQVESEEVGIAFCKKLFGESTTWIQTSYNNNIRKQYCGIGFVYDSNKDIFISPQPFPSWTLDSNDDWQPPIARPENLSPLVCFWDEETQSWI